MLCQKLIRLADRSKFSWEIVNEHETDELAANEDNAKRLEKAEKAAEQKVLNRKKAVFSQGGGRDRGRWFNNIPMAQLPPLPGGSGSLTQQPPGGPTQPRGASYWFRVPGPCFNCMEMGHLKANCPKLARPYPFEYCSS